jgi:predicted metal-dependent phosphoesterase TrpH
MSETVHGGRWTLQDRLDASLRELPFEVPAGAAGLTVELSYDRAAGVLDLGCLGPGGASFHGWSGGARDRFTIATDWATPGYLPPDGGELTPGDWRVLLRLHRIPPGGLDYEVRIAVTGTRPPRPAEPRPPAPRQRPPRRELPTVDGMRWLAGDCHSHSVHSDGALTIPELAELAAGRGLDFLVVTDHNTTSHHRELPGIGLRYGITLVPGQEVTTDAGHANAFGDIGWVDFRRPVDEWLAHAERAGGVLSVNHPLGGDCAWRTPFAGTRPRHAEVWHSGWSDRRWGAPLAWAQAWRPDVVAIGGSDFHRHGDNGLPGDPTTWVLAADTPPGPGGLGGAPTPAAVVAALAAGRTAVSAAPDAPLLLRQAEEELLALDAEGTVLVRPDGRRRVLHGNRVVLAATAGPHRLETHENEVIALCQ